MEKRIGQQIGSYRIIELLGYGNSAEVYLATHLELESDVAIKLLHAYVIDDEAKKNFLEEGRLVAQLRHPHIVRVFDISFDYTTPYLVMDYISHGTLRERYPKGSRLPIETVVNYVQQIASALQYAHGHKVVHCDVKPENILLRDTDDLVLSDFGISLIMQNTLSQSTQGPAGTPTYMAPEQFRGKPHQASDQYALGVIVYELLCGRPPFIGKTFLELMDKHKDASPPSLQSIERSIPSTVERVVLKALEKDPRNRFKDIQAFALALERANTGFQHDFIMDDTHIESSPPPTIESEIPHSKRRQFLKLGAGLSLGAVMMGTAGLLFQQRIISLPSLVPISSTPNPRAMPVPTKSNALYIYRGHQNEVFSAAWSPNGQYIASAGGDIRTRAGDSSVHVWKARDGTTMYMYPGHTKLVRMVAWHPSGTRVASASEDGTVQVWPVGGGSSVLSYQKHQGPVTALSWSPDGNYIASASVDQTVQVWDVRSGKTVYTFTAHKQPVSAVAWSPDGNSIASASGDDTRSEAFMVYVWNPMTGEQLQAFSHKAPVGAVAWSHDSDYVVTGDYNPDDSVRIWDIHTGKNITTYPGSDGRQIYAVSWSSDGRHIAAGDQQAQVRIWLFDAADNPGVLNYIGHNQQILSVMWSPDGKYIASAGIDRTVQIWDLS